MKHKCPNCGEFKYEAGWTRKGCGFSLVFLVPILSLLTPGMSSFYGGRTSFSDMIPFTLISILVGIVVIVYSYIVPQKTISYKCSNCNYTATHNL